MSVAKILDRESSDGKARPPTTALLDLLDLKGHMFPEMTVPLLIIHFNRMFPKKTSSCWGTPISTSTLTNPYIVWQDSVAVEVRKAPRAAQYRASETWEYSWPEATSIGWVLVGKITRITRTCFFYPGKFWRFLSLPQFIQFWDTNCKYDWRQLIRLANLAILIDKTLKRLRIQLKEPNAQTYTFSNKFNEVVRISRKPLVFCHGTLINIRHWAPHESVDLIQSQLGQRTLNPSWMIIPLTMEQPTKMQISITIIITIIIVVKMIMIIDDVFGILLKLYLVQ